MQRLVTALILSTLTACVARVDESGAIESEHVRCEGRDASDCAIEIFETKIGRLSDGCQEVVRATTINLRVSSEMATACPHATVPVLGCMTEYDASGAEVQVMNNGDRQNTATHELLHVALRCARGNPDSSHTTYGSAWVGLMDGE